MSARITRKLEKTKHPGIYKRGTRYVVVYRDPAGQQRKRAATTMAEARAIKDSVRTDISRGEYVPQTKQTLADYYATWIVSYLGRTKRGIRENTRADYAKQMERHVLPVLGRRKLAEIGPADITALAVRLTGNGLSASSVRLAIAPLKALLAVAFEQELIRRNPAANVRVAQPATQEDAADRVKALTAPQLVAVLEEIPDRWRPFYAFLAQTGVRISEALELRWRDVDFAAGKVAIHRRLYNGRVAPPKSKFGRRTVRLSPELAKQLWTLQQAPDDLVFCSATGTYLDQSNLMSRVLKPAAVRAGVGRWVKGQNGSRAESWVGHHTFRHTCATLLFMSGWNAKQVQVWLGHHSPAFTLETYVHLLPDDLPDLPPGWGNARATQATETGRNDGEAVKAETASTLAVAIAV